jgi:hexosaminidase
LVLPYIGKKKDTAPVLLWKQSSGYTYNTTMGNGSYGPPYTLTLTASSPFTLVGPDTTLSIETVPSNISTNGTLTLVFNTADNFPYPLRSTSELDGHDPGHPGRIWTNVSTSTHHPVPINFPAEIRIVTDVVNGSRVWVDSVYAGRFEVFVFGGRNTLFSWSQMALVAPLDQVEGGLDSLVLEAGISGKGGAGNGTQTAPPFGSNVDRCLASVSALIMALMFALIGNVL